VPDRTGIEIVEAHASDLATLCRRHRVHRLDLFGSTATGEDRPAQSDLDFLVEFEPLQTGYVDAYFGLMEELEQMFGRHVDLVVASAVRNPYFLADIERTKKTLYAA
jgi:predicted nucleotidyltransferase